MDIHTRPSTWLAVASWAGTGFMSYPSLASLIIHCVNAVLLAIIVWTAHREGRKA